MKKLIFLFILTANHLTAQIAPNYSINGIFFVSQINYYDPDFRILKTNNGVAAYFSADAATNIDLSRLEEAGTVMFNDTPLDYNTSSKFYSATNITDINMPHWNVTGQNSVPPMGFVYNGTLPGFDITTSLLNDTIRKSDTLFVTINNITNADSITIFLSDDNQLGQQHHVALHAPNYTNKYYIRPSTLSNLYVGPRAVIKIEAINYTYQTIAGKQYLFRNIFGYTRSGVEVIN